MGVSFAAIMVISYTDLIAGFKVADVSCVSSDKTSADDDLGKIEVDLKDLMHSPQSRGKMWERQDDFMAIGDEVLPGHLDWSVGYYPKVGLQDDQFEKQTAEPKVKNLQQLKEMVSEAAEKKLREGGDRVNSDEVAQQKAQDLKAREDNIIISAPPPHAYPTGLFSIQIHSISGLQFEQINKNKSQGNEGDDTEEGNDDLPSSYCTIILNHQAIFRSRTKPKNNKPFFNAGTERMIKDWRTTEIMISVRDARVHEEDALLGIIYLNLGRLFHQRCQIMDTFPLVGGIGYGRARISMVFRSLQLQLPKELIGWDYGTLEITGSITSKDLGADLRGLRLKLHSSVNRCKMYSPESDGKWSSKKDRSIRLAVVKRYRSCVVIEFRKSSITMDTTPAFAILWLKDIPDEEDKTITLSVWHGDSNLKRAQANCLDMMGERVGTIDVPVKFWPGLSGYHKRLASKNHNLKDIFEVLDTAGDNQEIQDSMEGDDSSDSDSSSDDEDDSKLSDDKVKNGEQDPENGSKSPVDKIKDFKDHHQQLNRKHRGLMQFKVRMTGGLVKHTYRSADLYIQGARTGNWMKTKIDHGKEHVMDKFRHRDRDPGIETEV